MELSSISPETLTVPLQPDISQFVKDIDFQVDLIVVFYMVNFLLLFSMSTLPKGVASLSFLHLGLM